MAPPIATFPAQRRIPREGFYVDPLAKLLSKTILNPVLTGVIHFALKIYPERILFLNFLSSDLSTTILRITKTLSILGLVFWTNQCLNFLANNNFILAQKWDSAKELVLVTGGSGGIGASVARRLAREGTRVVVIDILPLSFDDRRNITYFKCDLSDMEQIRNVAARIREEVGNPTVLINNAGLSRGFNVVEGSYHDNDLTLRINLLASFLMCKEFVPSMITKNHGHIFQISSMSAFIPPAGLADYAASKAGLIALHETLGLELKHRHNAPAVRTSVIVLSFTKTPLFKGETNQNTFLLPLLHVDTVGDEIVGTLYRGYSRTIYMPGMIRYLAWIRGAPDWLQHLFRGSTENLKVDFRGRQMIDPITQKLK